MKLRRFVRARALDVLGAFSTPMPGVHILNGHLISGEDEPYTFQELIKGLSKTVTFVNVEEAVQMIVNHEKPAEPVVAFTFDDGFEECYTVFAPVLEEFGVNALFFINPNYVDGNDDYINHFNDVIVRTPGKRPMRWKEIEELERRGHVIGAHTMDHYMISNGTNDELRYQIIECKGIIENHLGHSCEYFAFPYGQLKHASIESIEMACDNYKYVFSQSDYKNYFSFGGKVINRRHFEPCWPLSHVKFFISCNKKWNY